MNEQRERGERPNQFKMSAFASRVAGVDPAPAGKRPFTREMERPRTESYGELWRRANTRLSRF
jgi:hypothetical protein